MVCRVIVIVALGFACGFEALVENTRQRTLRYQIRDLDHELVVATLEMEEQRRLFQEAVIEVAFEAAPVALPGLGPDPQPVALSAATTLAARGEESSRRGF